MRWARDEESNQIVGKRREEKRGVEWRRWQEWGGGGGGECGYKVRGGKSVRKQRDYDENSVKRGMGTNEDEDEEGNGNK